MDYLFAITAAAAVPATIFCWMMGVAALALATNGENPRAVLAMPRTILRRCQLPVQGEAVNRGLKSPARWPAATKSTEVD